MTKKNSTVNGGTQASHPGARVRIHPHAQDRWHGRTPAQKSLRDAWSEAVRVRAPAANADETRLYAPYNALLVYRQGQLRTVLSNDGRLNCPALGTCTSCENLIDPLGDETCRWCGAETETHGHGRAAVTRGEKE